MSRTIRKLRTPARRPLHYRQTIRRPEPAPTFIQSCPDGKAKLDLSAIVARDSRIAGLREHKLHRRRVRVQLRLDPDNVAGGKRRRYGETYRYGLFLPNAYGGAV